MTIIDACKPSRAATDIDGQSWLDRRVAVVGSGRSGLAAAELLCRMGCRVRVTDAGQSSELIEAKDRLDLLGAEQVEIGGHSQELIEWADLVVLSPGVPEHSGPVPWAVQRGIPIISEIELAFLFCPSPIVAVTGTNGKSTAVTLIAQIARASGRHAIACGNLGVPFSSVVDDLTPESLAVVEVSSFQLLWCTRFRPSIGVLLNVGTNHLDRHHDPAAYLAAKARLFQSQTAEDWAVLNGTDERIVNVGRHVMAGCVWFGDNRTNVAPFELAPQTQRILTPGQQAVLQVGRLLGIADPLSWQVLRAFRGLEHRLEPVGSLRGVQFINDSKSTTPDSLLFALSQTRGQVVVIMGGRDKGMEFGPLAERLHEERVRGVVLIGESRSRLRALFNGAPPVRESASLDEAIRTAASMSEPGTTVLFSPACASFDMFRDFEDRGRQFKSLVTDLVRAG